MSAVATSSKPSLTSVKRGGFFPAKRALEIVRDAGGRMTAREFSRRSWRYRFVRIAGRLLNWCVLAGFGTWERTPATGNKGGRPTRVFVLDPAALDLSAEKIDQQIDAILPTAITAGSKS